MRIRLDPLPDGIPLAWANFARTAQEARKAYDRTLDANNGSAAVLALAQLATVEHDGKPYPASIDDAWGFINLWRDWRIGDPRIAYRAFQLTARERARAAAAFRARMAA